MPTGYTAPVQDGKIVTLKDFAWCCARGMGALVTMREAPSDAEIPERFYPDIARYDTEIDAARTQIERLSRLSAAECDLEAAAAFEAELKSLANAALRKRRYEDMLAKVEAWRCDDEVRTLRDFMVEQLKSSIGFDCSTEYSLSHPPVRLTGEQWREKQLAETSRFLAFYATQRDNEIQRVEGRNKWLAALRASLD